jgi:HSP20 family protein
MKLAPWRRYETQKTFPTDLEGFGDRFWNFGTEAFPHSFPDLFQPNLQPALNVAETEDDFIVTDDCPGMKEEDHHVETMGHTLVVKGERKWEEEETGKDFRRIESRYGIFGRTIPLPENARFDPKQMDAVYKKGVLTITVPKAEKTPTAKIKVHG